MSKPRRKTKPQQTWSGLEEPDVTGSDEAEEAMPIEFLRRDRPKPDCDTKPTEGKRCRKRRA